jgi:hypothetical protein
MRPILLLVMLSTMAREVGECRSFGPKVEIVQARTKREHALALLAKVPWRIAQA